MGGNVISTLTDAAEAAGGGPRGQTAGGASSAWFGWGDDDDGGAGGGAGRNAAHASVRRQQGQDTSKGSRRRSQPQTAFDAEDLWGDIDTTKVDLGQLAPRILQAQRRIDVAVARPVHRMNRCHDEYVRVLAWDPFRDWLISGGGDGWIRFWSTKTYQIEGEVDARHSVRSLLVLTKELVSGHHNGEVHLWDVDQRSRPRVQILKSHREAVYALAMLRSGELISGAEAMNVFVRNKDRDFVLVQTINEEILCACAVPFGGGESQVVTGNMKGFINVWETPDGASQEWCAVSNFSGHSRSVWSLCYVREAACVASGGADHAIRLWDIETWKCKRELKDHAGWVVGLSTGPGWLLSCSIDQTVRLWDIGRWSCARTFDSKSEVYCVCAFAGGRFAAAGAEMSVVVYGSPGDATDPSAAVSPRPEPRPRPDADVEEDSPERLARRKQLPAESNFDMSTGGYRDRIHDHIHGEARERTPPGAAHSPTEFGPLSSAGAGRGGSGGGRGGVAGALADAGAGPGGFGSNVALVAQPARTAAFGSSGDASRAGGGGETPRGGGGGGGGYGREEFATRAPAQPPPASAVLGGDEDLLFETRRAVHRAPAPAGPKYVVGMPTWVFSASQKQWLRARVVGVEKGVVTVVYTLLDGGEAKKQLLADSDMLRPAGESATAPPPTQGAAPPVSEWSGGGGRGNGYNR